eukprot:gene3156-biopygen415
MFPYVTMVPGAARSELYFVPYITDRDPVFSIQVGFRSTAPELEEHEIAIKT